MEGVTIYPASVVGRMAMSGESIEDCCSYSDDDTMTGLAPLDKGAQAACWMRNIESACNAAEIAALRIFYGLEGKHIESACEILGNILTIDGRNEHYVMTECWILSKEPSHADPVVARMVTNLFHDGRAKAELAVKII